MGNESSQLRKHLKYSLYNKLRSWYQGFRIGKLGENVWLDKNVSLMRFPKNIKIADDVIIKEGAKICPCNMDAHVIIGERTTIGYHTFIFASSNIKIGSDCLIAPFVYIVDSNHSILKEKNINQQPNQSKEIIIGDDVWIASNVTILKGVTIGNGAVLAAGTVVNKDIEAFSINAGSPSKIIGYRK